MCNKSIKINETIINAKIWDTAGQERFKTITKSFYRKAEGIVFIYDITNANTYNKLNEWLSTSLESIEEDIPKFLISNKIDQEANREVTQIEGMMFAKIHNMKF